MYIHYLLFSHNRRPVEETKEWDVFRDPPPKIDSGSMANQKCLERTVQLTKFFVYLIVFVIVLVSGVVSKGTIFFMTSQLRSDHRVPYCNKDLGNIFDIFEKYLIYAIYRVNSNIRRIL